MIDDKLPNYDFSEDFIEIFIKLSRDWKQSFTNNHFIRTEGLCSFFPSIQNGGTTIEQNVIKISLSAIKLLNTIVFYCGIMVFERRGSACTEFEKSVSFAKGKYYVIWFQFEMIQYLGIVPCAT